MQQASNEALASNLRRTLPLRSSGSGIGRLRQSQQTWWKTRSATKPMRNPRCLKRLSPVQQGSIFEIYSTSSVRSLEAKRLLR